MLPSATPWPADLAERYRREGLWEGRTIAEVVDRMAGRQPGNVAVIDGDRRTSYAELMARVDRLAARLRHERFLVENLDGPERVGSASSPFAKAVD